MIEIIKGIVLQGRFVVGEAFEHEGMSDVFKGHDEQLNVPVVIKFLPRFASKKKTHLFQREGRLLATLKGHRNIVDIVAIGLYEQESRQLPYIVCEYLSRGDLRQLIPLGADIDRFLCIGIDLASGMSAMHAEQIGVAHRDIKPSNLFLSRDGTLKIGDFGISKRVRERRSRYSADRGGTLGYRAPEAINGDADPKLLDIFSAGVTFYELLAGHLPYGQIRWDERQKTSVIDPAEPLAQVVLGVSNELSDLIMRMIDLDPARRPQSFEAIERALAAERTRRAYENNPDQDIVVRTPALQRIRCLLRDKIEKTIRFFGRSLLVPNIIEKPDWYADVFLRPAESLGEDSTGLADVFQPVYSAHYIQEKIAHSVDWVKRPSLITSPHPIDRCCAGLPIRMHEMQFEEKQAFLSADWFKTKVNSRNQIEYVIIRRVSWLCSDDGPPDNIIKRCYAVDYPRADWKNGFNLFFQDESGEHHPMSRDISTEIVIPLYDPLLTRQASAQDVLGVLNFEWDQQLGLDREKEICAQIQKWLYVEQRFPLSTFIAQVLRLSTGLG